MIHYYTTLIFPGWRCAAEWCVAHPNVLKVLQLHAGGVSCKGYGGLLVCC